VEQLTRLVARGDLTRLSDDLWAIPKRQTTDNGIDTVGDRSVDGGRWDGMEATVRGGRERLVSGRLDLHRDGFGFVRPDAISASQGKGGGQAQIGLKQDGYFIPPNEIHGGDAGRF